MVAAASLTAKGPTCAGPFGGGEEAGQKPAGWRAEKLPPGTAANDRAWAVRHGWTESFWSESGWLHPLSYLDELTLQANRAAWREDAGLPPGVAEAWPC